MIFKAGDRVRLKIDYATYLKEATLHIKAGSPGKILGFSESGLIPVVEFWFNEGMSISVAVDCDDLEKLEEGFTPSMFTDFMSRG